MKRNPLVCSFSMNSSMDCFVFLAVTAALLTYYDPIAGNRRCNRPAPINIDRDLEGIVIVR